MLEELLTGLPFSILWAYFPSAKSEFGFDVLFYVTVNLEELFFPILMWSQAHLLPSIETCQAAVIHMNVTRKSTPMYSSVLHFACCTGLTEFNPSRFLHVKFHIAQDDTCLLFFLLVKGGSALFLTSSHIAAITSLFCQFHDFNLKYGVKQIRDLAKHSSCVGDSLPVGTSTKTSAFIKLVWKLSGLTENFCDPQDAA